MDNIKWQRCLDHQNQHINHLGRQGRVYFNDGSRASKFVMTKAFDIIPSSFLGVLPYKSHSGYDMVTATGIPFDHKLKPFHVDKFTGSCNFNNPYLLFELSDNGAPKATRFWNDSSIDINDKYIDDLTIVSFYASKEDSDLTYEGCIDVFFLFPGEVADKITGKGDNKKIKPQNLWGYSDNKPIVRCLSEMLDESHPDHTWLIKNFPLVKAPIGMAKMLNAIRSSNSNAKYAILNEYQEQMKRW